MSDGSLRYLYQYPNIKRPHIFSSSMSFESYQVYKLQYASIRIHLCAVCCSTSMQACVPAARGGAVQHHSPSHTCRLARNLIVADVTTVAMLPPCICSEDHIVCMYVCMYVCIHTYITLHCTTLHAYVHTYAHIYIYIYIHAYIYIMYIYIYTHYTATCSAQ